MKIIVTSYRGYYVSDFTELMRTFCDIPFLVDVANQGEAKSDQLLRILDTVRDEYIILLEDDFFLTEPVDLQLLYAVQDFCIRHDVDRFSLQHSLAYAGGYWYQTNQCIMGYPVCMISSEVQVPFALDASIWKASFLRRHLQPGWSDAQIEVNCSEIVKAKNHGLICALEATCVMHYEDAVRDSCQVLTLQEILHCES